MRSSVVFSAVALLAQQVAAGAADSVDALSHGSYVASRVRRRADLDFKSGEYLKRNVEIRDVASSSSSAAPVPTSTAAIDLNPVLSDTETACQGALSGATAGDSGLVPCFNVNFFDNSTGMFQANIMLYRVSAATGDWNNTQGGAGFYIDMPDVDYKYLNTSSSSMSKRAEEEVASSTVDTEATPIRKILSARSAAATPAYVYTIMGNVTQNYMSMLTNSTVMRMVLTPTVQLTANSSDNKSLNTSLSAPASASFVDGWFSQAYLNQQTAIKAAIANPPPFVLPGVTLGISKGLFPIGLIVTSAWVILFTTVVGYGTFGRLQWRRAYRAGKPTASGK